MPIVEIMRILGKWALTSDDICELLNPLKTQPKEINDRQLYFDFKFDLHFLRDTSELKQKIYICELSWFSLYVYVCLYV